MSRPLGRTGFSLSPIAFGCGPVSGLLTVEPTPAHRQLQRDTVAEALDRGIDWFDTAAGYGAGWSETNLGRVLTELEAQDRVRVATKVRLSPTDAGDYPAAIERSLRQSLDRLQRSRITLLQLHNSITPTPDELPTSVSLDDVLRPGGILDGLERVRQLGLVDLIGLTGLGDRGALQTAVGTGRFQTIQLPINALLLACPPEGRSPVGEVAVDALVPQCADLGMGVFGIRVFAGGALLLAPPSPYTHVTKFFTLESYQRDLAWARAWVSGRPAGLSLPEFTIGAVLNHPGVSAAIVGFGQPGEIGQALGVSSLPKAERGG
jgi:aryl-alcohol dehydrogenase-like predicted oxidoreductase